MRTVPVSAGQPDGGCAERPAVVAFHELAELEESFPPCLKLPLLLVLCPRGVGVESALAVVREGLALCFCVPRKAPRLLGLVNFDHVANTRQHLRKNVFWFFHCSLTIVAHSKCAHTCTDNVVPWVRYVAFEHDCLFTARKIQVLHRSPRTPCPYERRAVSTLASRKSVWLALYV